MLTAQQMPDGYRPASGTTSGVNGYMVSNASAGIALIVPATTGNHPTLWNPSNSGVNASIRSLTLSYVSGNNAPTAIEWAHTSATGASIGTGLPIVTFTQITYGTSGATGNYLPSLTGGSIPTPKCLWSPAVSTYVAAPTYLRPTGLSLFTGVASTATTPFSMIVNYNGELNIAPGEALSLCTQAATTTALFQVCIVFDEISTSL